MIKCNEVRIGSLENLTLRVSPNVVRSLELEGRSIGFLFRGLRVGAFELISTTTTRDWILRLDQVVIVLDSIRGLIKELSIKSCHEEVLPRLKFEKLIKQEIKEKIIRDAVIRDRIVNHHEYVAEFQLMLAQKKIISKEAV